MLKQKIDENNIIDAEIIRRRKKKIKMNYKILAKYIKDLKF